MTAIAVATQLSAEEFLDLPDAKDLELVAGQPVERNVSVESSRVAGTVSGLLFVECRRTGEATVFPNDLGYRCYPDNPNQIRKPDVSVVRRSRLVGIDGEQGFMSIPADLVVEVISKNDLSYDVMTKVEEYLSAGFALVWLIHPNVRTATIYRVGEATALTLHEADEITAEPALTEFRCKVGAFFD